MRSGKEAVEGILASAGETDLASRGGGLPASRAALPQSARKDIEAGFAQIFPGCATGEAADRKVRVEDADADLFPKGMANETGRSQGQKTESFLTDRRSSF